MLIWVCYPLLWISAGGQCYLKSWLSSKALRCMLHEKHRQKNSNFSISLLNRSAGAEHKRHHFSFCMQSCLEASCFPEGQLFQRNNLIICGCLYYLESDLGRQRLRAWFLFTILFFFLEHFACSHFTWRYKHKHKGRVFWFLFPLKTKDLENSFSSFPWFLIIFSIPEHSHDGW